RARVPRVDRRDEARGQPVRADPVPRRAAELPGAGPPAHRREPDRAAARRPGAGTGRGAAAARRDRALRGGQRLRQPQAVRRHPRFGGGAHRLAGDPAVADRADRRAELPGAAARRRLIGAGRAAPRRIDQEEAGIPSRDCRLARTWANSPTIRATAAAGWARVPSRAPCSRSRAASARVVAPTLALDDFSVCAATRSAIGSLPTTARSSWAISRGVSSR